MLNETFSVIFKHREQVPFGLWDFKGFVGSIRTNIFTSICKSLAALNMWIFPWRRCIPTNLTNLDYGWRKSVAKKLLWFKHLEDVLSTILAMKVSSKPSILRGCNIWLIRITRFAYVLSKEPVSLDMLLIPITLCFRYVFLAFCTNFWTIKTDLSGNTVWPQASGLQKLAKMNHFWHFN